MPVDHEDGNETYGADGQYGSGNWCRKTQEGFRLKILPKRECASARMCECVSPEHPERPAAPRTNFGGDFYVESLSFSAPNGTT